jgi:hypothetical protein
MKSVVLAYEYVKGGIPPVIASVAVPVHSP